jgi:hypothetical protein
MRPCTPMWQCVATSKQCEGPHTVSIHIPRRLRMIEGYYSTQIYPISWDYHTPLWESPLTNQFLEALIGVWSSHWGARCVGLLWSLKITRVMYPGTAKWHMARHSNMNYFKPSIAQVKLNLSRVDPDFCRWRQHPRMMAASWRWGKPRRAAFLMWFVWSKQTGQTSKSIGLSWFIIIFPTTNFFLGKLMFHDVPRYSCTFGLWNRHSPPLAVTRACAVISTS